MPAINYPPDLPISQRREEIMAAIREHQVVVVAGETGSGKTTQLPKMCLDLGLDRTGKVGCTQPRRVAAMSVSKRVAEELGVVWGREVGCKMRFADDTNRDTRLKFMTDGILLAEIQSDPMLRAYSTLIIDEAHERSLNIDFLLGYLKTLLVKRSDLKVIITSATIDTEMFSKAFDNAPIIEVSGRLFPVEIRYAPVESFGDEKADLGYIDAACHATENALIETNSGDVLVFMPTERDIREMRDIMDGHLGNGFEVLGLYGRQTSAEQQRIFSPGSKRRVVIATNVAETSLTIPRIRYVIDAGLARISRYNPRTRTKRLPVEDIAQSSANQRAGRAGRVQDGVCIRLYTQEDFDKRERFATPEIQRANLAEVILRMKAFNLGEIEDFPFIEPPSSSAIRSGYELLHELGALGDTHELTGLGKDLAKLPVDPTLGRMLLYAKKENVMEEMLIIASGLSIPDPRERPENAREQAAAAHKAFNAPDSDFMSLLKLWNASPDPDTKGGTNAMRRFCKASYLSFTRMREWRDVWSQLRDAVGERGSGGGRNAAIVNRERGRGEGDTSQTADLSAAIHRSILSGLIGHIACKEERNSYKASSNRIVSIFPGSGLYERREKQQPRRDDKGKPIDKEKAKQPGWIMAGEIVQTSQLFAHTCARIDPNWIVEVGAHLCKRTYSEPHWNQKAGRVLVWERVLMHGLEVRRSTIDFGRIDALGATQLFVREVLLDPEARLQQRFPQLNLQLRDKLNTVLIRVRSSRRYDLDEVLFNFYCERLKGVSSIHDLNRIYNQEAAHDPQFLIATEEDFTPGDDVSEAVAMFPDEISLGHTVLPLSYAYTPGSEHDGVTVQVPVTVAEHLTSGQLQWMVPGLREEIAATLLRALPRRLRRELQPIDPKVKEIALHFNPGRDDLLEALARFLSQRYRVPVIAEDWPADSLPQHLQPRVAVIDKKQQTVAISRDLAALQASVEQRRDTRSQAWEHAVIKHERPAVSAWNFGDLPESIDIEEISGNMLRGYPGLAFRDGDVDVRLFKSQAEAVLQSPAGIRRLAEKALARELAWLLKELRGIGPASAKPAAQPKPASFNDALNMVNAKLLATPSSTPNNAADWQEAACQHLITHAFRLEPLLPLKQSRFESMLEKARRDLPLLVAKLREFLKQCFDLQAKLQASKNRYPGLETDLTRLLPGDLLTKTPHAQLLHLPRYLKAMQVRAERAVQNPAKDDEKAWQLDEFQGWQAVVPAAKTEAFRWMLEEYRVQLFAQELGTAQPVSPKRLREMME